jgi:hypothetical protein
LAIDPVGVNSPPRGRAARQPAPPGPARSGPRRRRRHRPPRRPWPARIAGVGLVRVSDSRSARHRWHGGSHRRTASARGQAGTSCREHLGDEEGQFKALPVVEPRVAHRLVTLLEVGVEDLLEPPMHSVTSLPVSSTCSPPGTVPRDRDAPGRSRAPRRRCHRSCGSCSHRWTRRCCRAWDHRPR